MALANDDDFTHARGEMTVPPQPARPFSPLSSSPPFSPPPTSVSTPSSPSPLGLAEDISNSATSIRGASDIATMRTAFESLRLDASDRVKDRANMRAAFKIWRGDNVDYYADTTIARRAFQSLGTNAEDRTNMRTAIQTWRQDVFGHAAGAFHMEGARPGRVFPYYEDSSNVFNQSTINETNAEAKNSYETTNGELGARRGAIPDLIPQYRAETLEEMYVGVPRSSDDYLNVMFRMATHVDTAALGSAQQGAAAAAPAPAPGAILGGPAPAPAPGVILGGPAPAPAPGAILGGQAPATVMNLAEQPHGSSQGNSPRQ